MVFLHQYFAEPLPGGVDEGASAAAAESGVTAEGGQPGGLQAAADLLLQCVAAEAPALLPPQLFLHSLVRVSRQHDTLCCTADPVP